MSILFQKLHELVNIAKLNGILHALDTENEKNLALKILEDAENIAEGMVFCPETNLNPVIQNAITTLKSSLSNPSQRLQINPLFGNNENELMNMIPVSPTTLNPDESFDLLTILPDDSFISFNVYYMDSGIINHGQRVFLNYDEWNSIINLFLEASKSGTNVALSDELQMLSSAVAVFEKIVGKKAGTANDHGSWEGNDYILNNQISETNRQQDCVGDALTVTQLLHAMQTYSLFQNMSFDIRNPIYFYQEMHVAAQLKDNSNNTIILDSWIYDNGETSFIGDFLIWSTYIELLTQKFNEKNKKHS